MSIKIQTLNLTLTPHYSTNVIYYSTVAKTDAISCGDFRKLPEPLATNLPPSFVTIFDSANMRVLPTDFERG